MARYEIEVLPWAIDDGVGSPSIKQRNPGLYAAACDLQVAPEPPWLMDGEDTPRAQVVFTYREDGSFVEQQSELSDTGDGYYRRVWSSGCRELFPLLLPERSLACVAAYGAAGGLRVPCAFGHTRWAQRICYASRERRELG